MMAQCRDIQERINELTSLPAAEQPVGIREHLAGCQACASAVAAARVERGLLAAVSDGPEPPADFADRVMASLPGPRVGRAEEDLWGLGWRLVPTFAATLALTLFLYQASPGPAPTGLVPAEGLSSSEELALGASPPEPDLVLEAVMEGGET